MRPWREQVSLTPDQLRDAETTFVPWLNRLFQREVGRDANDNEIASWLQRGLGTGVDEGLVVSSLRGEREGNERAAEIERNRPQIAEESKGKTIPGDATGIDERVGDRVEQVPARYQIPIPWAGPEHFVDERTGITYRIGHGGSTIITGHIGGWDDRDRAAIELLFRAGIRSEARSAGEFVNFNIGRWPSEILADTPNPTPQELDLAIRTGASEVRQSARAQSFWEQYGPTILTVVGALGGGLAGPVGAGLGAAAGSAIGQQTARGEIEVSKVLVAGATAAVGSGLAGGLNLGGLTASAAGLSGAAAGATTAAVNTAVNSAVGILGQAALGGDLDAEKILIGLGIGIATGAATGGLRGALENVPALSPVLRNLSVAGTKLAGGALGGFIINLLGDPPPQPPATAPVKQPGGGEAEQTAFEAQKAAYEAQKAAYDKYVAEAEARFQAAYQDYLDNYNAALDAYQLSADQASTASINKLLFPDLYNQVGYVLTNPEDTQVLDRTINAFQDAGLPVPTPEQATAFIRGEVAGWEDSVVEQYANALERFDPIVATRSPEAAANRAQYPDLYNAWAYVVFNPEDTEFASQVAQRIEAHGLAPISPDDPLLTGLVRGQLPQDAATAATVQAYSVALTTPPAPTAGAMGKHGQTGELLPYDTPLVTPGPPEPTPTEPPALPAATPDQPAPTTTLPESKSLAELLELGVSRAALGLDLPTFGINEGDTTRIPRPRVQPLVPLGFGFE